MKTYVVLRRHAWHDLGEATQALEGARAVTGFRACDEARWVRSYLFEEAGDGLGSVCVYEAFSAAAVARHSHDAGLAYSEIAHVVERVIERPDWRIRMA